MIFTAVSSRTSQYIRLFCFTIKGLSISTWCFSAFIKPYPTQTDLGSMEFLAECNMILTEFVCLSTTKGQRLQQKEQFKYM